MADFVSSSSSPSSNLLSQISSLLSSMRSNPKDNQIFTQAFQLINTNYTSLTQSHSHPFCHFNGQSPPLEGHLQTAMLRTFGLEKCAEVDSWIEGIGKSIYACRECYVGFEEARERLTSDYLWSFSPEKITKFNAHIDQWEETIATSKLSNTTSNPVLSNLSSSELFATLSVLSSPSSDKLRSQFSKLLGGKDIVVLPQLEERENIPAGMLSFLFEADGREVEEEDIKIRNWLRKQLNIKDMFSLVKQSKGEISKDQRCSKKIEMLILRIKEKISKINSNSSSTSNAELNSTWETMTYLLLLVPSSSTSLAPTILSHLHDKGSHFLLVLRAFNQILSHLGPELWTFMMNSSDRGSIPQATGFNGLPSSNTKPTIENDELPAMILSSILDNSDYEGSLLIDPSKDEAPSRELLFRWMGLLLKSLHLRDMEHYEQIEESGESPSSSIPANRNGSDQFDEVFKRLANFLFERMQQSHVNRSCRLASLGEIFKLLTDHFEALTALDSVGESAGQGGGEVESRKKGKEKETDLSNKRTSSFLSESQPIIEKHCSSIFKILTIYSKEIATLAMKGRTRNANESIGTGSSARRSALRLLARVFNRDTLLIRSISLELGSVVSYHSNNTWKNRVKKVKDENGNLVPIPKGALTASEIYKTITKDFDFHSRIKLSSDELWNESYSQLDHRLSSPICCAIFLEALSNLAVFQDSGPDSELEFKNHLLKASAQPPSSYVPYKTNVKAVVKGISRSLWTMRHDFKDVLTDYSESASESQVQELCFQNTYSLFKLGLSPDPLMHKTMQALVRSGYSNAESRGDCFKVLFQISPNQALRGLGDFLQEFVLAATTLIQANEAAKWVIRSAADVLEVLCASTDGVLRSGTKYSLLDNAKEDVVSLLPGIWKMMCSALATIFTNAPRWSSLLDRAQLTAWLRDVNIFGVELVEQLPVVQQAYRTALAGRSSKIQEMNADLAMPIKVSISFLRLNDDEILHESLNFIHRALERFDSRNPLPEDTKATMLEFCQKMLDQASKSEKERLTLLTIDQLEDLQDRLDPEVRLSRPQVVTIDSSDEDESFGTSSSSRDTSLVPSNASMEKRKKKELKQSKLPFSVVIEPPAKKKKAPPAPSLSKAFPTSSTPVVATNNRYQAAGAVARTKDSGRSSSGVGSTSANSKLSQLRSDFNSSRSWNGNSNRAVSKPAASISKPTTKRDVDSDTTDSSDESSGDERAAKGLHALVNVDRQAAIRNLSKSSAAPIHKRSAKIMSNPEEDRRRKERADQERKRLLKKPPDFNPLYESVLSWNYYHDGQSLPSLSSSKSAPPLFAGSQEYMDVFGPMMLLETWAQILQAKEQIDNGTSKMFPVEVQSRANIDNSLEVGVTLSPDIIITSQSRFSDQEIVVLRQKLVPSLGQQTSPPKAILAKIKEFKMQRTGPRVTLICYLQNDRQGTNSALVDGSKWELGKLISLTTTHREFAALSSLEHYPLRDRILKAQVTPKAVLSRSEVQEAKDLYGLNEPQASAVVASLKEPGFSLIQGPPGTGKTSTICGLVSAFIKNRKPAPVSVLPGQNRAAGVKKKIFVCAPSNAAIDEIAKRLQTNLKDSDGNPMKLNIVRTGRDDTINVSVKEISLERLIEERIAEINQKNSGGTAGTDPKILQEEIRKLNSDRSSKENELQVARETSANVSQIHHLENELRVLKAKRSTTMARLDEAKDKQQDNFRQRDAETRKVRVDILTEADVICSTLGSAGHESLANLAFDFETVIIDEAAQAREVESLIPLRYGCKQCILVGDPLQLPPTVISKPAENLKYGRSLFVRMFNKAAERVHLLSIQYRMHPEISIFPSKTFYESKLQDGPNMAKLTAQPWHSDFLLKPFKLFSTSGLESAGRGHSKINREEAEVALAIYQRLLRDYSTYDFDRKIGIVSAYKEQVFEMKRVFRSRYGEGIFESVDFNTVDGFQGQEKSIIIFSCVRAGTGSIGFLSRFERLNVAITRAKSNLFIIGNAPELRKDQLWSRLVSNAEEVGALQAVTAKTFSSPKSKAVAASEQSAPKKTKATATTPTAPRSMLQTTAVASSSPKEATKKRHASNAESFPQGREGELGIKKRREAEDQRPQEQSSKRKEKEKDTDSASSASSKRSRLDSGEAGSNVSVKVPSSTRPAGQKTDSNSMLFDLMGIPSSSSSATASNGTYQRKASSTPAQPPPSNPNQTAGPANLSTSTPSGNQHPASTNPAPPKSVNKESAKPSNRAIQSLFAPKRPQPKR